MLNPYHFSYYTTCYFHPGGKAQCVLNIDSTFNDHNFYKCYCRGKERVPDTGPIIHPINYTSIVYDDWYNIITFVMNVETNKTHLTIDEQDFYLDGNRMEDIYDLILLS